MFNKYNYLNCDNDPEHKFRKKNCCLLTLIFNIIIIGSLIDNINPTITEDYNTYRR